MNRILVKALPYLLASLGIVTDWITTQIGLSRGFIETHAQYSLLSAFLIFFSATTILMLIMPDRKPWRYGIIALSLMSFLGAVNNILVLLGVFGGLIL